MGVQVGQLLLDDVQRRAHHLCLLIGHTHTHGRTRSHIQFSHWDVFMCVHLCQWAYDDSVCMCGQCVFVYVCVMGF